MRRSTGSMIPAPAAGQRASGRAAVQIPTTSVMLDDGEIERRVRLIRPMEQHQHSGAP
jgi:hypothetical protein